MNKKFLNGFLCLALAGVTVAGTTACTDSTSEYTNSGTHTLNEYYSGTFGSYWNPHDWENSLDSVPLGYTSIGLYNFEFNDDKDGYKVVPEMASADPTDVTATYKGQYNIPSTAEDGEGYAYTVTLNPDAKFDDGTAITAETYVESYKLLIDKYYNNFRSTTYETDNLQIANSKLYHYQGETSYSSVTDVYSWEGYSNYSELDSCTNATGRYFVNLSNSWGETGTEIQEVAAAAGVTDVKFYDDDAQETSADAATYVSFGTTWEVAYNAYVAVTVAAFGDAYQASAEGWAYDETFLFYTYPERDDDWFDENVGVKALDDYTLLIVSDVACSEFNFKYTLSSTWLVEPSKYVEWTTTAEDGTKTTTYNCSASTSVSYGPYKLSSLTTTGFSFEKNTNWYGYTDGEHEGEYQTDNVNYKLIDDDEVAVMSFVKGDLDELSLSSNYVDIYGNSEQATKAPQSYTMSLFNNADLSLLNALDVAGTTTNADCFSNDNFRMAISYALDRESIVNSAPGSVASGVLLNSLYISDVDNGVVYRTTDAAKAVYEGLYGEGVDDVSDIYSVSKAVEYFNAAYDELVEAGLYTAGENFVFNLGATNSTSDEYVQFKENLQTMVQSAISQSKFGSSVTFTVNWGKMGSDRYNALLNGENVFSFCAWGGNTLDPYSFLQVYFTSSYNYMPAFNPSDSVTVSVNGTDVTKSYSAWYSALSSGEYGAASGTDTNTRTSILAQLELAYLKTLNVINIYSLGSTSLHSYKINYPVDEYVSVVGFGGIQYLTYNMDDDGWSAYVSDNNNQLPYAG